MSQSVMLNQLVSIETYAARYPEVFPCAKSLQWFVRVNKIELIEAGALIMPAGRKLIVSDKFDKAVMAIGRRRAVKGGY